MADSSFRTFRRDAPARDTEASQRDGMNDPLAELARLIGQSDAHGGRGRDAGQPAEGFDDTAPTSELDWAAADEDYAQHSPEAEQSYAPPRSAESYQPHPADGGAWPRDRDYEDEPQPAASRAQPLPYIPPAQGSYQTDEQGQYETQARADAGNDAQDEYEEEAAPRRPRGTVVVVAVLGLAVLGTAGALGYRAMFGGSVIPSLPPIIAPGNKPIKIVPPQAGAPSQADAGPKGTGEHLVTHEEQPVNVQSANPVPRVVTTIPVISNAPDAPLPGGQPPAAPAGPAAPAAPAAPLPGSAQSNNPAQPLGATDQLTSPALPPSGSKPVRTVTIRADQPPAARPAAPAPAPAAHPVRVRQAATKPTKEAAPPPRTASAGPLSIVPTQEGGAPPPPPRTHTAMTRSSAPISSAPVSSAPRSSAPMSLTSSPAEAAPSGAGGYAVQVSSQRSEAEAQAAFRSLQAKYPQQLRDRHAIVRRADLGAKGVYYRALVGPFASAEQAASLCSSLKAAGGNCLIQRN